MSIRGTAPNQNIIIRRGDILALYAYNLGSLATIDDLWFTIKRRPSDADTAAVLQVSLATGLLYVNGVAAGDPLDGSITVVSAGAGTILISVAAEEMASLYTVGIHDWDIQTLTGDVVETLTYGHAYIAGDATRSIV